MRETVGIDATFLFILFWPGLLVLIMLVTVSSVLILGASGPFVFRPRRVALGYGATVLATLAGTAALLYVPVDVARENFRIQPGDYWSAWLGNFLLNAIGNVFLTLAAVAVIGAPTAFVLARCGFGTTAWLMVVAAIGSALLLLFYVVRGGEVPISSAAWLFGYVLLIAFALGTGLGLPLLKPSTNSALPPMRTTT